MTIHPVVVIYGDENGDFEWGPGKNYYAGGESRIDVLLFANK